MKIEEICRTCLSESSDLRSIFKLGVIAGKTTTLSNVLMEFTKLTINESDNFPDKMCYGCVIQANQSFAFLQTCLESDRYLREKLSTNKLQIENNEINDNLITEAETQTVYLYNAINIEGENQINVHIAASEMNVIKNELASSCKLERGNSDGKILTNSEDVPEKNKNETEIIVPDLEEDDSLETEILEEIENEDGNSASSFYNVNNEDYYEENNTNDTIRSYGENMENFEINEEEGENVRIIKLERSDSFIDEEGISYKIKRKRKSRNYSGKINIPGPPYTCNICQKHLSTKSSYKYHMQLHSDSTPFLCNECGEGFKTRNAYEGHMTTHDINNPHKCEICGKIYRQANSLKTHMLTHTGEKPFLCGICGKGMTQKSGFKKHMLVHSGEMPFECEMCHKKFRYSSNLIAHKKTHAEKKENFCLCKICNKICNSYAELKKHMNIHVSSTLPLQNPFQCPVCGKFFSNIEILTTHLKLLHKKDHIKKEAQVEDNELKNENFVS